MFKILATGSKDYNGRYKIKKFIGGLKNKHGSDQIHISTLGNKYGADNYIKKNTLYFDIEFHVFNDYHTPYNMYSMMPKRMYNKEFKPQNYYIRNSHAIKWADLIILFFLSKNKHYKNLMKEISRKGKKYYLIG